MDISTILLLKIIILSLVESISEFLPISSTLHLLTTDHFLQTGLTKDPFFLTIIQMGSLSALFWYYRGQIKQIINNTLNLKKEGYIVFFNLLNAFIVCSILGLLIKKFHLLDKIFPSAEFNLYSIMAGSLIIVGLMMLAISKKENSGMISTLYQISPLNAYFIGAAQTLSMIPGVSRLGITLVSGICFNLSKQNAINFSFLLALPTFSAASGYEFISLYTNNQIKSEYWVFYLMAFFASLVFSLLLVSKLIKFLNYLPIRFFAYYRFIFAVFILLIFLK